MRVKRDWLGSEPMLEVEGLGEEIEEIARKARHKDVVATWSQNGKISAIGWSACLLVSKEINAQSIRRGHVGP